MKWQCLILLALLLLLFSSCTPKAQEPPLKPAVSEPQEAKFEVAFVSVEPPEVRVGEIAVVRVGVRNIGSNEGVYMAILSIDGVEVETRDISVLPGATEVAPFLVVKDKPGTYQVTIGGVTSGLKVLEAPHVCNQSISGFFMESQIWSGEVVVTGDVTIWQDLTILPGTIVRFAVQDDQHQGYETPADGYNDLDPTRLMSYGITHSSLTVKGKLNAVGTPEERILFTSAAESPKLADWEAIHPQGDGSLIEWAIIEWSRNGITPGDQPTPNSIFRNNVIRHTLWGAISTGWSSCQVYNNEIYECGHEGVDVQGGNPIIENNTIYDSHCGIVILRGSAVVKDNVMRNVGNGIHVGKNATPVLENNHIVLAPHDSKKEWRYGDFAYRMFGDPVGTPILTEVYRERLPRYAVPAYRIEGQNYIVELPLEAQEWLIYGWENDRWQKIEAEITANKCKLPRGYSVYVLIPNPTDEEKDIEKFNIRHSDIYKIMAS